MSASSELRRNFIHGPAKRPEWSQMIRLGGDRVAVLFEDLRKAVGKVDGIIEELDYSGRESRWVVQYKLGGTELFTARISPGLLEADLPLDRSDIESLLRAENQSATIQEAARRSSNSEARDHVRFELLNRRKVRSFASLVRVKARLAQKLRK